jgi:drug/metabolite transporter (DMT)-like permease
MLRGAIGCVAMVLYYLALVRLPMADAVLLFFVNVPATALAAWLFAGERMGPRAMLGAASALVGLVLVLHPPFLFGGHEAWGPERALGVAAGLGSAALSACAFLTIRAIGRREPALVVALYFHCATVFISAFPLLVLRFPEAPVLPASLGDVALLVGVAIGSFFGQLSLTRGFQLLPAGRASAINLLQVLFSTAWGWLAFGDVPTAVGFAGGVLIVAGALLSGGGGGRGGGGGAATEGGAAAAAAAAGGQHEAAGEDEDDAEASVALTSVERSAGSKVVKHQLQQQQQLREQQQQQGVWGGGGGGGGGGALSSLAAREAAGGGVGSRLALLPRSQQEALAISAAAAATLELHDSYEDDPGRRRSSNVGG